MKSSTQTLGFRSLLVTQFLGAFNDNAFKFVIVLFVVDHLADSSGGTLFISLAGAALVMPFICFSSIAGWLADHYSKVLITRWVKFAEIVIMTLGVMALHSESIFFMIAVMFLLGTQSAIFSPSKYGMIPELVENDDLSMANGLMQMWTNMAIIIGSAMAGFLVHTFKPDTFKAGYVFIVVAGLGWLSSFWISQLPAAQSQRQVQLNVFKEMFANIRDCQNNPSIFLSMLGLAYFGFLGALFQLNITLYAKKILFLNDVESGLLLAILAIGIGFGSLLAGRLSQKKIELGLVPLGAIGLTVFSILLGIAYSQIWLVVVNLFLLGVSAGFYIVPLNALLQAFSDADHHGQVLATNNFLMFSAMLMGSVFLTIFRDPLGLNAAQIFWVSGILTVFGTGYIVCVLPAALIRFMIWMLTHTLYRINVIDSQRLPSQGAALLVSNHVSFVDALLVIASTDRPVRFLMERKLYHIKILNPIMKLAQVIPISSHDSAVNKSAAIEETQNALKSGDVVCIFAEGQLSRTGNILGFKRGLEKILIGLDCPVIPIHLDRVWGSIFSYEGDKFFWKWPKIIPYPVTISYGNALPASVKAFDVRQAILELSAKAFTYRFDHKKSLAESFVRTARQYPFRICLQDSSGQSLSYAQALMGAVALSKKLRHYFDDQRYAGVMLPSSVGGALTNVALMLVKKVPVNINFTSSSESISSVIQQCDMKRIITSKRFIEKVSFDIDVPLVYIEDILVEISVQDRLKALWSCVLPTDLTCRMLFGSKTNRKLSDVATVMFTSGSTGEPKGVMLTHANVRSNLEGLYQVFRTQNQDKILGVLPLFHSFGFTATLWFPLICGIGAVYHPNPLDYKMVGSLIKKHSATILMSTPTFLNGYVRRCSAESFASLRLVVVGAEKLKKSLAEAFEQKFGLTPMEGYGCTELSPIVTLNLPDCSHGGRHQKTYKPGKIGQPLPGIVARIVDPETGENLGVNENGLLLVKGPNVMLGYLNDEEKTNAVINDGWYNTGDIANIDADGFVEITDRLSRFSKIAGEMVPHIKVEEAIQSAAKMEENVAVVISVADERKGERLAVLYRQDIDVDVLITKLKESGLPNLWIPERKWFFPTDEIPLLGSGKTNLAVVKQQIFSAIEQMG